MLTSDYVLDAEHKLRFFFPFRGMPSRFFRRLLCRMISDDFFSPKFAYFKTFLYLCNRKGFYYGRQFRYTIIRM